MHCPTVQLTEIKEVLIAAWEKCEIIVDFGATKNDVLTYRSVIS